VLLLLLLLFRHAHLFEDIGGEYNIPLAAKAKTVREFDDGLTRGESRGFASWRSFSCSSHSHLAFLILGGQENCI
jgi:hypothetical protein